MWTNEVLQLLVAVPASFVIGGLFQLFLVWLGRQKRHPAQRARATLAPVFLAFWGVTFSGILVITDLVRRRPTDSHLIEMLLMVTMAIGAGLTDRIVVTRRRR